MGAVLVGVTARGSRRPLVILGVVAGVLLIAALVVFLLMPRNEQPAAAPSSPSPTPSASTTATATPTPIPTPTSTPTDTDVVPRAAEVVMAATGFTIIADDGSTLLEFRWRDEVEPVVAALTAAFGAEPELDVQPGDGMHFPDYTVYDWAGFTLFDMIVAEGGKPRDEYSMPTWASIRANEVNGVAIQPEFGLAVGSPVDAVRASGPDDEWAMPGEGGGQELRFVFDIDRTFMLSPDGPVDQLSYSVYVDTSGSAATDILYRPHSGL